MWVVILRTVRIVVSSRERTCNYKQVYPKVLIQQFNHKLLTMVDSFCLQSKLNSSKTASKKGFWSKLHQLIGNPKKSQIQGQLLDNKIGLEELVEMFHIQEQFRRIFKMLLHNKQLVINFIIINIRLQPLLDKMKWMQLEC